MDGFRGVVEHGVEVCGATEIKARCAVVGAVEEEEVGAVWRSGTAAMQDMAHGEGLGGWVGLVGETE